MKQLILNYTFDKTAKQVTFLDFTTIRLDSISLITNVTSNIIIYNFADNTLGGTITNNILTLTYNTSSMANTDKLMIIYDDAGFAENVTLTDMYLKEILNVLSRPISNDPTTGRVNINNVSTLGTLTTVSTTADLTRLNNIGATSGTAQSALYVQLYGQERMNWNQNVRTLIT